MAYQTGTATTPLTLLTTLVTWLSGLGWTTNLSTTVGSGRRAHMSKNGVYVNLRAASLEAQWTTMEAAANTGYGLSLYLGTGYSGAAAWDAQAGGPSLASAALVGAGMMLTAGPYPSYHFHSDADDNVVVVVQHTGGVYGYIGWGRRLSKESHTYDLPYFFGSTSSHRNNTPGTSTVQTVATVGANCSFPFGTHEASSSTVRAVGFVKAPASIQPGNNNWVCSGIGTNSITGAAGALMLAPWASHTDYTIGVTDNASPHFRTIFNEGRGVATAYPRALVLPCWLFAPDPITSRQVYLGAPPSVFGCSAVGNGWASQDVITIAGLDYRVYPGMAVRNIP